LTFIWCFCRKYPEIKTYEQRCSYKEDFAKEYTEFTETKERLDLVTQQFNELKERLKKYPEDSHAAKVNVLVKSFFKNISTKITVYYFISCRNYRKRYLKYTKKKR
jgi:hypothetical protein